MAALVLCKEYYSEEFAGFSIPASEHSAACGKTNVAKTTSTSTSTSTSGLLALQSNDAWGTQIRAKMALLGISTDFVDVNGGAK